MVLPDGDRDVQIPIQSVEHYERLCEGMPLFLNLLNPADIRKAVQEYPELFTEEGEQLLSTTVSHHLGKVSDEYADFLIFQLQVLRRSREIGVHAALAEQSLRRSVDQVTAARDLLRRYSSTGRPEDLRILVDAWTRVVEDEWLMDPEAAHGHGHWLRHHAGMVFRHAFEEFGDRAHLERSLALLEEACFLAAHDSVEQGDSLYECAKALLLRHGDGGDAGDVEWAGELLRAALTVARPGSAEERIYMTALARIPEV
ncbi:hypothetical protein ACFV23_04560 [Streptomyces sp. NPDC059627]